MVSKGFVSAGLLALFFAAMAHATIFGALRGIVHDPSHRPIEGAEVTVRALTSSWMKTARTNSDGEFEILAVPLGGYRIVATSDGFSAAEQRVLVSSGSSPILHFQLSLAVVKQTVETSESAGIVQPDSAAATTLLERSEIERTPGADRTNSLAMIVDYVPGAYVAHDQLHVRGGHQVSWLIDGVPVPNTNIASNAGPQFDPKDADYIEMERGGYSAEYGDRTYGVFNVVPRTGFERNKEGEIVASYGNFNQSNDQVSFGSHTERFAYYASVNGNRSDLGLETPGPVLLHDMGDGLGAFSTLLFNTNQSNQLRLVISLRRDSYQIPNTPDQQAIGIRDNEREADALLNLSWVHTAGPGLLLTVSPFFHFNRADYAGGSNDVPFSPRDNRASTYAGGQVTLAAVSNRHNAQIGIYAFGQHDDTVFGLTAPDGTGLRQNETANGNFEALFLEDQYKPVSWLTLSGGVRLTRFSGLLSENAVSPRLGAAVRIPRWNWVIHGYYGRFYQAPPLSTISGPLLAFAAESGFGFLPLHGERDEQQQLGLTIPVRGWSLDIDHFRTRARNFFDHDVLGNSNIFLPLTIDSAYIRGWETTLRSPRLFRKGVVHLAYSRQVAQGQGAVNGGLTDFSPPAGPFFLDHDQRHTLNTGFELNLPWRSWSAANVYYGSGFTDGTGPAHLPGHTTVDLMLGKTVNERWSVSINALNVANRRFLLDNSPTFGGVHFADPRQVFAELRYRFRY